MSQGDLLDAYLGGEISRRIFIRRLVATGMSLSAAAAYAYVLNPSQPRAQGDLKAIGDFYDEGTARSGDAFPAELATSAVSMETLVRHGELAVRVTASKAGVVPVSARVARDGLAGSVPLALGSARVAFARAGSRTIRLRAGDAALDALRSGRPMVVTVVSGDAKLRIRLSSGS